MSMNVYIYAEYEVLNLKNKQKRTMQEPFDAWQTPTEDTYRIVRSDDPIKAYCDWVLSISKEEQLELYALEDFLAKVRWSVMRHTILVKSTLLNSWSGSSACARLALWKLG